MKITNRNAAFVFGPADVNGRFERGQCHVHVRWICGNAMFARAENGEATIYSRDSRAARAGIAFVTRHGGVPEIHATGSLQQVASSSRHVSKLGRCAA